MSQKADIVSTVSNFCYINCLSKSDAIYLVMELLEDLEYDDDSRDENHIDGMVNHNFEYYKSLNNE